MRRGKLQHVATIWVLLAMACGARTGLRAPDARVDSDASPSDAAFDVPQDHCVIARYELTRRASDALLVIDRSGSMSRQLGTTGTTRWGALTAALAESLPRFDATIAFGAVLFPGTSPCSAPARIEVEPALGNAAAINGLLRRTTTVIGTPTSAAVEFATAELLRRADTTRARFLVLATDGSPNCNTALDPATCVCVDGTMGACRDEATSANFCLDDARGEQAVAAAFAASIPTYVIGIDDEMGDPALVRVLERLAVAGGRPHAGTPLYYRVRRRQDLDEAFATIQQTIARCSWIASAGAPTGEPGGTLRLDGSDVARDPERRDGWDWTNVPERELTLFGPACDRARADSAATLERRCGP